MSDECFSHNSRCTHEERGKIVRVLSHAKLVSTLLLRGTHAEREKIASVLSYSKSSTKTVVTLSCETFRRVRDPTVSAPYIGVYVRMNLTESIVSFASKVVLIICYSLRATIPPNDSITGMPRRWQPSLSSSNDVNTPIRDVKRS